MKNGLGSFSHQYFLSVNVFKQLGMDKKIQPNLFYKKKTSTKLNQITDQIYQFDLILYFKNSNLIRKPFGYAVFDRF